MPVDRPGTGFFRKNKYKDATDPNDKKPDYRGDACIHCPSCQQAFQQEIAGWIDNRNPADQYLSLKFQVPRQKPQAVAPPPAAAPLAQPVQPMPVMQAQAPVAAPAAPAAPPPWTPDAPQETYIPPTQTDVPGTDF